jgi:hypothetical protein
VDAIARFGRLLDRSHESYFEDCFSCQVEERHAQESLELTQLVLRERPELLVRNVARRQDDGRGVGWRLDQSRPGPAGRSPLRKVT